MKDLTIRNRRQFLRLAAQTGLIAGLSSSILSAHAAPRTKGSWELAEKLAEKIPYVQRPLPYDFNALEPVIDTMTMEIHYSKHAQVYAKNLSDAVKAEDVDTDATSLEALLGRISKYSEKMRNNAGGHYNHELFWRSMCPEGKDGKLSDGKLKQAIDKTFGSVDAFKTKFSDAAQNRFGSGWVWLVNTPDNKLLIGSTPNQDNPLMNISELKGIPLLGLDVWEHAYYLKYLNRRADYIAAWWNTVNWATVEHRYSNA